MNVNLIFDKVETPLIIIQGTKDAICTHEAGLMFSSLKRLNKTAELVLYKEEDHWHGTWKVENILKITIIECLRGLAGIYKVYWKRFIEKANSIVFIKQLKLLFLINYEK